MTCVLSAVSMRTTRSLGAVTLVKTPSVACAFELPVFTSATQAATSAAVTAVPSENL